MYFPQQTTFPVLTPLGKMVRLNVLCDIVNEIFPLIGKKSEQFFLPLIFSGIPWWSDDWLACGIGSKVFSQHSVLREMPFSVNKSKTIQPLETIIIPWDNSSRKKCVYVGFSFFVFFSLAQKDIFPPGKTKLD